MAAIVARLPGISFETRTPPVPSPLPRMDIAGFVGFAASGPINVPVAVEEPARFHDIFGEDLALARDDETGRPIYAELPAAVRAFFRNGGARCWVVRVAGPGASANRFLIPGLLATTSGTPGVGAALAYARSAGSWSDAMLVNATIGVTPISVRETSVPPGFTVGGLRAGDLVQLDFADLGIVAFQAVPEGARPPLSMDVPNPSHWFRHAVRTDLDPAPPSPPDTLTWLALPTAVRWLLGAMPPGSDPTLPVTRWGVGDKRLVVELDRSAIGGVQAGSWLLVELSSAPAGAQPFLLVQVDRIQAAEDLASSSSADPVWVTAERAWWPLVPAAAAIAVQGVKPRASIVTFDLWTHDPSRGTPRLDALGCAHPHPRYWGAAPDDDIVFRSDLKRPTRLELVPASLLESVLTPRFPLASARFDADPAVRPLFLPLGIGGFAREEFYQPALSPGAAALSRDGLASYASSLFLDPELAIPGLPSRSSRTSSLMSDAFQIQYINHYDAAGQTAGRPLTGIHALLPVEEISMLAVPDAAQRSWAREASALEPLDAPTLIEVSSAACVVHVDWIPAGSPADDALTYTVQASLDARFSTVSRSWTVEDVSLDHDAALFCGCATPVFYRVRAISPTLGPGPWSNTLWEVLPPGPFERCPDEQLPAPGAVSVREERGRLIVEWGSVGGDDVVYTLEQATDPEFVSAAVIYTGTSDPGDPKSFEIVRGAQPIVYFRVAAEIAGLRSPWSATVRAGRIEREAFVAAPSDEYDESLLLDVQTAAVRLCAARADLHAVLGLPAHFLADRATSYVARLSTTLESDGPPVLSYGSVVHPWVVVRETAGRADLSTWAIAPEGPVCGTIAGRTLRHGAWYSPANQLLNGVVDTQPTLRDAALALLQQRVNPIVQQPRGFVAADALTLYPGDDLGELHVRRLLILLRRLAMREGTAMVFRNNDDSLRRLVQREFERVLGDLFVRGAFAGETHEEGYQVVTDDSVNPVQSVEAGRFIAELRVAPSEPMVFLTVRLVQEGGTVVASEGA